ncbi:DUF2798 domain-containing protein [Bacillus tropicus]|uniref:DUF2798 domain-containing protein n=1 Tax=Bacillus shihchuchen TaxID=3036942 RepID=A0ABT7KXI2_9BACI|nr:MULTISPECIES: DUF2798 domain-containing protein [Bacillus]MDL2418824.1 DUF2798 domain-containing protein [Bacillus shihchuchen]OTX85367.1 hypothetical protein BK728_12185 [Bacillus thuringiensis serovar chanpaisis]PFD92908.1 DUF2798 domain-containing protein [Bacillus anthracis]PNK27389.1 hypothetical protein CBR56_16450 [Bacillus thuringiensis]MED3033488.1 DUF2798 domain-containing protein [Bacillus tropicus]
MKINKKFEPMIFNLFMILGISSIISFVMVSMNVGYTALFLKSWLKTWAIAFVLAFLASKLLPFVVKKIMKIFTFVENDA